MWPPRALNSHRKSRAMGFVRWLARRFLPADFRARFGEEMHDFWESQSHEPRYRSALGRGRLQIAMIADVVRTGLKLRLGLSDGGRTKWVARSQGWAPLRADVRFAFRSLRRSPLYTAVAVVTLALGVGATTALFTVVDGVLLRPLPFPDSQHLVRIDRVDENGETDTVAWPDFADWRNQASGVSAMAAYTEDTRTVSWDDATETLQGARVTRDFFDVMGIQPIRGRTFSPEEDRFDGIDAVIISNGLWQTRFGADPDILDQSLTMDGVLVPIVGVMPPNFQAPAPELDFWRPLQDDALLASVGLPTGTRDLSFLEVVARLDGTSVEAAHTNISALAARIDREVGDPESDAVRVISLQEYLVGDVRTMLLFLLGAVGLLMAVASANVAGLTLSRTATRSRELAVRSALGAGGRHLFRLLLVECLVLGAFAAIVGLGVAWALTRAVIALAPPELPRMGEVGLGVTTVAVAVLITGVASLAFGLGPALTAGRSRLTGALASGGRGSSASRGALRPQRILVSAQVATSVALLCAAALLINSFVRLNTVERGFDTGGVFVASIQPSTDRFSDPSEVDAYYTELTERLRAIPGVDRVTATYSPPLLGNDFRTRVRMEEESEDVEGIWAGTVIVRDDFFETTGTPLLSGRSFESTDRMGTPLVAVVNETMARALWPDSDPIGRRFLFHGGLSGSAETIDRSMFPREAYTVIGVAGDVRRSALGLAPIPEYYRPHRQIPWESQFVILRSALDPTVLIPTLRDAVRNFDRRAPTPTVRTMGEYVSQSLATPRFRTLLLSSFAVGACLLSMVGLYAVMAMAVARRERELGVRLALGATPSGLLATVLAGGARLVIIGLLIGLASAWFGTKWLASMLYEVQPRDLTTYGAVVAVTAAVALLACYGPARKASRVDPAVSLSSE